MHILLEKKFMSFWAVFDDMAEALDGFLDTVEASDEEEEALTLKQSLLPPPDVAFTQLKQSFYERSDRLQKLDSTTDELSHESNEMLQRARELRDATDNGGFLCFY